LPKGARASSITMFGVSVQAPVLQAVVDEDLTFRAPHGAAWRAPSSLSGANDELRRRAARRDEHHFVGGAVSVGDGAVTARHDGHALAAASARLAAG